MISPEYQGKRIHNKGRCGKCNCEFMVLEKEESKYGFSFAIILPVLFALFSYDIYQSIGYEKYIVICVSLITLERLLSMTTRK